jgi:hypothetical protein
MKINIKDTAEVLLQSAIGLFGVNILHTPLIALNYVIPLLNVTLGDTVGLTVGLFVAKILTNTIPYFKGNKY